MQQQQLQSDGCTDQQKTKHKSVKDDTQILKRLKQTSITAARNFI